MEVRGLKIRWLSKLDLHEDISEKKMLRKKLQKDTYNTILFM